MGGYLIAASGATDPDYSITFVAGMLAVTPAPLTIAADDETMTSGATVPALAASYSGFVNGDTAASLQTPVILSTDATPASPAGDYAIHPVGATSRNYSITFLDGTLAVTAPPVAAKIAPPVAVQAVTLSTNRRRLVTSVVLTFSGSLDPGSARRTANYRLATAGKGGSYVAKNARSIKIKAAAYDATSDTVTLTPAAPFSLGKPVQLRVNGSADGGLDDAAGRPIDGDRDGRPGGDFVAVLDKATQGPR